ncbi:MAG TPA: uracil-DNA glycosylase [Candidatus Angelobacter sp.]|nr:uracil-DNA glycosylase [Candidatus Angelobacter sp.]
MSAEPLPPEPPPDCTLCPRLAAFRAANRAAYPDFHNAPVASFGPADGALLIVGLAPGLKGANRTGRPFTGDYAGDLLYRTLLDCGLAAGSYDRRPDDDLTLVNCRVTNAVRCVPPENKPTPAEARTCRRFLEGEIKGLRRLRVILALGRIAHAAVVSAAGGRASAFRFAHGALHELPNGLRLVDSYHCSRYNTQTGVLTPAMFHAAVASAQSQLDPGSTARRSRESAGR